MRMRWLVTLAAVLAAAVPGAASALDAPHDASFSDGECSNCHRLYTTTPSGAPDYNPGCVTCHDGTGSLSFGFAWLSGDQAVPGKNGTHHNWSSPGANATYGAALPSSSAVRQRMVDDKLQCITCHNPHDAAPGADPASIHTSIPVGVATDETGTASGPGNNVARATKLTLVTPGTTARGFRVKVQTVTAGVGGTFIISHDFGLATPSWYNYAGSWVVGTETGAGRPYTKGSPVALDVAGVTVTFSGDDAAVGDYWDFYVSFPFLRLSNVDDSGCAACHKERFMDHTRAKGLDASYLPNGTRTFSHAVGVAIDAATIRDASGVLQSVGDGNSTNDLMLKSGAVRCTTCHAVHNADSNSLSKDAR